MSDIDYYRILKIAKALENAGLFMYGKGDFDISTIEHAHILKIMLDSEEEHYDQLAKMLFDEIR